MSHAQQNSNVIYLYPEQTQEPPEQTQEAPEQPRDYPIQGEEYFELYLAPPPPPPREPIRILAPLGWTLILLTLAFNVWTIESVFAPGSHLGWPNTLYIYLSQVCMATAGAIMLLLHHNHTAVKELRDKNN
jgi:hypothetical protein